MSAGDGTTLFVATTGGHLAQLVELANRMTNLPGNRAWVTFDSEQAHSLLADEKKFLIPYIAERDLAGVLRGAGAAQQILRAQRPVHAIVSTGSAIALSFLPYAALRGIEAHYIESAARVLEPSLTGKLLQLVPGIQLYRQYPQAAGGRWKFSGSIYDGFRSVAIPPRPIRRIVVTLGTAQPFPRLIERLVSIIPAGIEVLWQVGHTPVNGLNLDARPFIPARELAQAMREADVVIAHAGNGSAFTAIHAGKRPILVPRDPRYGEVVDAHQSQISTWLNDQKLAFARSPDSLCFEDLQAATAYAVERLAEIPGFQLERQT